MALLMTDDERSVLERLTEWARRLNAIMAMYGQGSHIPAAERDAARELYKRIKDDLREEHRRLSSSREPEPTPAEQRWYVRSVHKASTKLHAPTNSASEKWFSGLYDACDDFTHVIFDMKHTYGLKDE